MIQQYKTNNTFDAIRTQLFHQKKTWGWLARKLGVSETYLQMIARGQRKGEKQKEKIAKALGLPVEDLWPEQERESA